MGMTLFEVICRIEANNNSYKKSMDNFENLSNIIASRIEGFAGNKNYKWIDFYKKEKLPSESFILEEDEEALEELEKMFS